MEAKLFEIRDRMTLIPAIAIRLGSAGEAERWLTSHAGYGLTYSAHVQYVLLGKIAGGGGPLICDPDDWDDRTMANAHRHIAESFGDLEPGAVVDVEFILGETTSPKQPQRIEDREPGDQSDWDANLGQPVH